MVDAGDLSVIAGRDVIWTPQAGPQTAFIRCPFKEVLYGGAAGGGKLLSDNELVVTPFGYRRHGDLKVGDTISSVDGGPCKVVHVTERRVHPMCRVEFDDGSVVVAGRDHLWNYSVLGKGRWRKSGLVWKVGTTGQIMEMMDSGRKIAVPLCSPVKVTKSYKPGSDPRRIDPYLLGLILGDGSVSSDNVRITSADREILGYPQGDWRLSKCPDSRADTIYARGETRRELLEALDILGLLNKRADAKFVPQAYLWNTVDGRLAVLRGLMDTDGYIDERGQAYFTSTSEQLAIDVRWLVFSLGGRARITSKATTYTHRGEKLDGLPAFNVTIRMPDNRDIVTLPRKRDRANAWRENGNGELKRRIRSIEYCGDEECHCIVVDHPSSLYLVGDFVVTHNSDALLGDFASGIEQYGGAWKGILVRREYKQLEELEWRALEIFSPHYGSTSYKSGSNTWHFKTTKGEAQLRLRAIDKDQDVLKHIGHQFSWIGIDELTLFPNDYVLGYLMTRLRSPKGAPTYVRLTTNPGNVGHSWVKDRFKIGKVAPMEPFDVLVDDPDTGGKKVSHQRIFIPAKLTDNKILMERDPNYMNMLNGIEDPVMRRALRDGDWDIIKGAAFPEFDKKFHVVDNHIVPDGVRIWRSMDWGYDKPFACLWAYMNFDGAVNVCGEYYGCGIKFNTGISLDEEEVIARIKNIEAVNGWDVREAYLDPACFFEHGGSDSIADRLGGAKERWRPWSREKHWRMQKKQLLHNFLKVVNGTTRLTIQKKCVHLIRTLGTLPLDERPGYTGDVDTRAEDHLYDALCGLLSKNIPTKEQIIKRNLEEWEFNRIEGRMSAQRKYGGW